MIPSVQHHFVSSALRHEIQTVSVMDHSGAGHPGSGYDGGWIHRFGNTRLELASMPDKYPCINATIRDLLRRFDWQYQLAQVMVNMLDADGVLLKHRDGHSPHYRFHFPVLTNSFVYWWDEFNGHQNFLYGNWYGPVPYSGVLHSMRNNGKTARWHIVADLTPPK